MKKKLNIAYIIDVWYPFIGGGQVHLDNLSKNIKAKGDTFEIFGASKTSLSYRIFWSFLVILKIFYSHKRKKFSLIHSHGYNSALTAYISGKLLGVPAVHTVHGSNLLDLNKKGLRALTEKILLTKLNFAAQITVSRSFIGHTNVNKHIYYIPNGVDLKAFDQVKAQKNKKFTVVWVGRKEEPLKDYSTVVLAINKARLRIPKLELESISSGRLIGEKLIKAYKKAHLFILPSLSEGQPITLLEAWASKLPVIVTSVGDNPFMVKNGNNGYLTNPGDVQQLVEYIYLLYKDPKQRDMLGENGYY